MAFKCHDKFDPAKWFILFWAGQIVFVYAIFHNQFQFSGYGLVFIAMLCLTFSIGSLFGHFLGNKIPEENHEVSLNFKTALLFLQISIVLALLNVVMSINANGFKLSELFSFQTLLELNATATDARYTTNVQSGIMNQFSLIFVYMSPLYGGYLLPLLSGRKRIWCYLSVLPALLISLTQALKYSFIADVVLFIVGIAVSSYANNKDFFNVRKSTVLKSVFFSVLFLGLLFLSMLFRAGRFDAEILEYMTQNFVNYAFGHLPAFDAWFTNNIGQLNPEGGIKTFYGISNFLGLAERQQGIFNDFVYFGKSLSHQIPSDILGTNVYSLFRFLLEDFGFVGSFIMVFLTGILSGFSWLMVKRQKSSTFFQTILIAVFFSTGMSFISSVWAYTSFIATVVMFYFVLSFSFSKQTDGIVACQKA